MDMMTVRTIIRLMIHGANFLAIFDFLDRQVAWALSIESGLQISIKIILGSVVATRLPVCSKMLPVYHLKYKHVTCPWLDIMGLFTLGHFVCFL